jgi:hypothetical protein
MTITAPSGCGTDFVAVLVIETAALKIFAFHRTRIASVPVASIIGGHTSSMGLGFGGKP